MLDTAAWADALVGEKVKSAALGDDEVLLTFHSGAALRVTGDRMVVYYTPATLSAGFRWDDAPAERTEAQ